MGKFNSTNEILQFALAKEKASIQFYQVLSEKVTDSATQAIFRALVKEEQKHATAVELELMKDGCVVSPDDSESSGNLEMNSEVRSMDYLDALTLAIQKERTSFQLYAELMALSDQPEAREIFYQLAEEEVRHILKLEQEHKALSPQTDP